MKSITYFILTITVLGSFCNFVWGASSPSKTAVIEHIQSRINSSPGKHCNSVVLTNSSSDGYTGYIKWEDGGITDLNVKIFGNQIQYSFGYTSIGQKPALTSPTDGSARSNSLSSDKTSDFFLCVYVIGGILLFVGIAASIIAFVKRTKDMYDYNILDAANIGLVGTALVVLFVPLLLVDVVPKQGTVSWVPWVGCALVSLALFISMFIRTTTKTSFCRAVIAFPIQVIVGPWIILFFVIAIILYVIVGLLIMLGRVFVILLLIDLIMRVVGLISDRRRK